MRKSPKHVPISGDAVVNTVWGNWFDDLTRSNLVVLSQSARVEVDKDFYVLDGTLNAVTLTLSERNEAGHQLGISCINSTNACTIDLNGNTYYGSSTSLSLSAGGYYYLKWTGSQWVGIKGSSTGGGGGGASDHNDLTGLQGGTTDEYYHLSNADYTEAVAFLNGGSTTHTGLDGHIADTSIHFTQANIDHTAILNRGTNTHAQIDTAISNSVSHIADTSIHYAQTAIDHTVILNRGTNTHAQIDTHISSTSNPHSVTANQVLPSQSGNSGKYLTTDGTNSSWATVAGGGVSGSGTTNYIPLWTGSSALGDSVLSQSSGDLSATGNFNIASTKTYKIDNSNVLDVNGTNFARIGNAGTNTGTNCFFGGRNVGVNNPNNWNIYSGISIGTNTPSSIGNGYNVAFGGNMFNSVTTASRNTGIGISVFLSLTTGEDNFGAGFSVGSALTTGSGNSLIGSTVAPSLTTGSNNTAFSSGALTNLTTGSGNLALGFNSLYRLISGQYNVGCGWYAGYWNTGTENVCVGPYSGSSNVAGDENVFIGTRSVWNASAGLANMSRTTAVGGYAGSDTLVSDCVYLGWGAGSFNTRTNTLFIHNTTNITSPLIYGEFDNKHLRTGGSFAWSVTDVKTTTYTTAIADGTVRCDASGGAFTVNLHTAVGYKGKILVIKRVEGGTNTITVDGNSTETIDGATTQTITTAYGVLRLQSDGANWMTI